MEKLALLTGFVTNAIDGIIIIDERGIITTINPSACTIFGYEPDDVIGKNVSVLMPQPDRAQHDNYIGRYQRTHLPRIIGIGREVMGLKSDGTVFPFRLGVSEVEYKDRHIYVGFIHDLTQQKKDEEQLKSYASHLEELVEKRTQSLNESISELEEAKAKLTESLEREKELGQLKSRFVSMASHEFRTPLHALQLSASLIGKYAENLNSPEIEKHVGKIKNSVGHLTSILNDFLHLEKLESGKVQVHLAPTDIRKVSDETADEIQVLAKPGQIIAVTHNGIVANVPSDASLLKSCLLNLLSNAVKYSEPNTPITIVTDVDDTHYTISVEDRGMGIPEEDQEHLFEAFFRANNANLIAGTGLGLTIVTRYVGLLGGSVSFKSTFGKGTIFTLKFPIYEDHIGD
ncbi:histidine kinase [Flavobacterium longum]|uniref:PAS domain-containing sensor histidine kinase n=1 Tax=Flavobacterium longum TaxID=1299340 RepID=UPI0039EB7B66